METVYDRFKNYDKAHCWQYEIKRETLESDLNELGISREDIKNISISDFTFEYVPKENKGECSKIKKFIERYEWLGKLPNRPTHRFACYYNGVLGGVVIMATPNTFSDILGKEFRNREKLISRGASASWTPKNLASWLISKSMNWMVSNTEFRIFSAYSDPEAKELGTIYQSLNFLYIGQKSGAIEQYFDKDKPNIGWHSSRNHRHWSAWRRYSIEIYGKDIFKENCCWVGKYSPNWKEMPKDIVLALKEKQKEYTRKCDIRYVKPKHKYIYILGKGKKETKRLRKLFFEKNNSCEYPKVRGE